MVVAIAAAVLGTTSAQANAAASASFASPGNSFKFAGTVGVPSAPQVATLVNTGTDAIQITAAPADFGDFKVGANTCTTGLNLVGGANCTFQITFVASTTTAVGGSGMKVETSIGTKGLLLRGNAPVGSFQPNTITFAGVVGQTSAPQAVTLENGKSATGTMSGISIQVTGPFSVDSPTCADLPVGGQCVVNVTFTPPAAGSFTGKISLTSNDPIIPGASATLTGTATARGATPIPTGPGTTPGTTTPGTTTPGSTTPKRAAVTGFKLSPRSILTGGTGKFRFNLSAAARVTIVIERRLPGKRVRYQRRGSLTVNGKAGANSSTFRGRIGSKLLPRGTYRAKITARNTAGASTTRTATFTVRARRR